MEVAKSNNFYIPRGKSVDNNTTHTVASPQDDIAVVYQRKATQLNAAKAKALELPENFFSDEEVGNKEQTQIIRVDSEVTIVFERINQQQQTCGIEVVTVDSADDDGAFV